MTEHKMRTVPEQFLALQPVADKVGAAVCNARICFEPGDVVCLVADECDKPSEIVCAVGGYDVWREGRLAATNLAADDAAAIVIAEYKAAKVIRIMKRLYGKAWHRPKYDNERARITAEVMDNEKQRQHSDNQWAIERRSAH